MKAPTVSVCALGKPRRRVSLATGPLKLADICQVSFAS